MPSCRRAVRAGSIAIFMLLVPFLMGESVRAFSWLLLLGSNGAVPWVIRVLGGGSPQLLGSYWAIVLGLLQVQAPLATLILIPGMRKVPADLERAAQIMGARPGAVWRRIIVPLTRPSLAAAAVVIFALCMTEYAIPSALGLGATPFVANSVSTIFFSEGNIYFGAAFSVILIVVVIVSVATIGLVARARPAGGARRLVSRRSGDGDMRRRVPMAPVVAVVVLVLSVLPSAIVVLSSFSSGKALTFPLHTSRWPPTGLSLSTASLGWRFSTASSSD